MPADPCYNRPTLLRSTVLRHTWEPMGRYTCPACGEVLLQRDPNDLCPSKVALRLATKDAEVDRLTAENERLSGLVEEYRGNLTFNGWSAMPEGVEMARAEVDRLTAELAEARAKALEEAARVCDAHQYGADSLLAACQPDTPTKHAHRLAAKSQAAQHCAASIRSITTKAAQ